MTTKNSSVKGTVIFDETRVCKNCYSHLVCAIYNPNFDNFAPSCNLYMGKEDYEKVVRCKDCIYNFKSDVDGYYVCSAMTNPNYVPLNHFCGYGERKE